jgi:hypothetical protein
MRTEVSGAPPSFASANTNGIEREREEDHEDHQGAWGREEQEARLLFLMGFNEL